MTAVTPIGLQKDPATWPIISHWAGDKAGEKKNHKLSLVFSKEEGRRMVSPQTYALSPKVQKHLHLLLVCVWGGGGQQKRQPTLSLHSASERVIFQPRCHLLI